MNPTCLEIKIETNKKVEDGNQNPNPRNVELEQVTKTPNMSQDQGNTMLKSWVKVCKKNQKEAKG